MIDLYRAAITGDSGKRRAARARTLRTLLAQHGQHLVRLKARLIVPPGVSASPSPSAGGTARAFFRPGRSARAAAGGRTRVSGEPGAAAGHRGARPGPAARQHRRLRCHACHGAGRIDAGTRRSRASAALQAALAAEKAAIFGYGVAGAHLTGSSQAAAERDWTGHNQARDTLAAMISAASATPDAAQAYYQLPFTVHDGATATALAAYLEDGVSPGLPRPGGGQRSGAPDVRRDGHAEGRAARRLLARPHPGVPRPVPTCFMIVSS